MLGGAANQRRAGVAVGSANFLEDSDGSIRRVPAAVQRLRSFAATTALLSGLPARELRGEFASGPAWIDFPGSAGTVPTYSFAAVLHQGVPRREWVPASALRGKIVVVGATAPDLQDAHTVGGWTSAPMSGPELEADAISTLMTGAPLQPTSTALDWLVIVLAALVLPALAALRLRWPRLIIAGVVVAAALLVSAQLAFDAGTIILLVAPLGALIVAGAGAVLVPLASSAASSRSARAARPLRPLRPDASSTRSCRPRDGAARARDGDRPGVGDRRLPARLADRPRRHGRRLRGGAADARPARSR